jgi:hypothetical protein
MVCCRDGEPSHRAHPDKRGITSMNGRWPLEGVMRTTACRKPVCSGESVDGNFRKYSNCKDMRITKKEEGPV